VACAEGNVPDDGGEDGTNRGYRFGVLDVHGWTASPYYAAPDYGEGWTPEPVQPPAPANDDT
jgi:hypothetical protein